MEYNKYLEETKLLNYSSLRIKKLIITRGWEKLDEFNKFKEIYNFVRNEILFGYNKCDKITAEKVLKDGYGQCNTKGILFMALLRSVNIPCRIHCFTIDKKHQYGTMKGLVYKNAPNNVLHSWVEVLYKNKWYQLETFILDEKYLRNLQVKFEQCNKSFYGHGVAVKDFKNINTEWNENNTYIQCEGINNDYGIYESPDQMLLEHKQEISKLKEFMYRAIGRHLMNINVKKIRNKKL